MPICPCPGISVGFENYEMSVNEGNMYTVCIEARYSSTDIRSFFVLLNTRSITAGMFNYSCMQSIVRAWCAHASKAYQSCVCVCVYSGVRTQGCA